MPLHLFVTPVVLRAFLIIFALKFIPSLFIRPIVYHIPINSDEVIATFGCEFDEVEVVVFFIFIVEPLVDDVFHN